MAKRGRPTKYKDEFAEIAFIFCSENGFTDKKLALAFDTTEQTINVWKKAHPEFFESIKAGKDEFDSDNAEKSLLKRVKGFKHTEVTKEPDDNGILKVTKKVTKTVAPDPTSMIFWLKNRRPARWRDKQEHTIGTDKNLNLEVNFVKPEPNNNTKDRDTGKT